jgi:electron transfer flavoprotein alpha subunit
MTLSSIWVLAEPNAGGFTSTSLELLTHARSLGGTVSAVTWGGRGATLARVGGANTALRPSTTRAISRARCRGFRSRRRLRR